MKLATLMRCILAGLVMMTGTAYGEQVIELNVDTHSDLPIAKTLHGFNTNMISGEYGYADEEFQRQASQLRPQMLRFPGGTIANYYHWQAHRFRREDMVEAATGKYKQRNLRNLTLLRERRGGEIRFDDFAAYCTAIGAQAIIVVNLFSGTPEESAAWVRHAKSTGMAVAGWELGNELYLPRYRKRIRSPDAYIELAKAHARAMRAQDPKIRLAVAAHPAGFQLGGSSGYAKRWNRRLAQEDFFDAYVVHPYLKTDEQLKLTGDNGLLAVSEELFLKNQRSFRQAETYYRDLFGQREMWLTEWNLRSVKNRSVLDTLLHALYVADFAMHLLDTKANVPLAAYHVLAGPWNGFPTFHAAETQNGKATRSTRRSSYPVFQLLGELYARSSKRHTVALSGVPTVGGQDDGMPLLAAAAFRSSDQVLILVLNRSPKPFLLRVALEGRPTDKLVRARHLTSKNLTDSGKSGFELRESRMPGPKLSVPRFSFSLLEVR